MAFKIPDTCVRSETGHLSEITLIGVLRFSLLHSLSDSQGPDKGLDSSCSQHLSGKGNPGLLQPQWHTAHLEKASGLLSKPSSKPNMFLQMIYRTSITETVSSQEYHRSAFKCFDRIRGCPCILWWGNGHGNCSWPKRWRFLTPLFQLSNSCSNNKLCHLRQNLWHGGLTVWAAQVMGLVSTKKGKKQRQEEEIL